MQDIQEVEFALRDETSGRSTKGLLYVVVVIFIALAAPFAMGFAAHRYAERQYTLVAEQPLGVFWEAWNLLDDSFYGVLPSSQERTYGAIRGALETLSDPYTIFLEPQSGEVERDRLAGAYGGVGVDVWRDADGNVTLFPYDGSPAEAAGVEPHDHLIAVDGMSIDQLATDEILVLLRGEIDSEVALTISRPPTPPFDVTIARQEIRVPSVSYRILEELAPQIGYVQIASFTERTGEEAAEAFDELLSAGASGLILDLRDNGGGLIAPAVDVADLILDGGVILYEESRNEERAFEGEAGGIASEIPLVVLVNRSTASAAEIVAGAIQARERGVLIGTRTYGKGSVQLIYELSDGSSVHVTSAVWLLPNREPVEPDGLTPDIAIEWTDELEDPQLRRAVSYLQTGE